jgi:pimeloyl-ACP methyl ester carboxylesterase
VAGASLTGVRRTLLASVAVLMFAALAGATYQGVATAFERRRNPHPGRMIDVGGHQLHLYCVGEGQPTVVLQAPAVVMSAAWGWVQQDLMPVTRACSYDRAGLGWSEAGDSRYDPTRAVDELRMLLERSAEKSPYVMVGQELGAALAVAYASRYRGDVAALVLIDRPGDGDRLEPSIDPRWAESWPWLARTGLLRASRLLSRRAEGLPESSAAALGSFLHRPDHLTRAADELSDWDEAVRLGSSPLDPRLRVEQLQTTRSTGAATLNDAAEAKKAAAAIANVVNSVRRGPA